MDWRRITAWAALAAALLVLAAAWALHALVDPERLKKAARDRALAAWERELLLGDVHLDLLPVPSLRANKVSFANPGWAREPHLLQADLVRADLELLPLLAGKVRVKRLSLEGVRAGLEVADDGAVTWELGEKKAPEAPGGPESGEGLLQLATLHVRNANIVFRRGRGEAEPWHVQEALIEAGPGHRDVRVEASLERFGRPLRVNARFADLSGMGTKGAATDGRAEFDWGGARLAAEGRFPLEKSLAGADFAVRLEAGSLHEVFAFFGIGREKGAPVAVRLQAREAGGRLEVRELEATLGALKVTGEAKVALDPRPRIEARLEAGRVDWLKTLVDAGGTVKPPRKNEEVFHPDRVAWGAVTAIGALEGRADVAIGSLRLANGLELADVRARAAFGDRRLEIAPFSARMLGGSAQGAVRLDGAKRSLRFELDGEELLLARWFHERGSKLPFEGGPMRVRARLALSGDTYRELAASVDGRLTIGMGKAVWRSPRAGEAEEKMVRIFSPRDGTDIDFECAAADLHFKSGRASGRSLVGARTDVSQLLASGVVDAREEAFDLRGRLVPRSGPRIGLASFAGEVQVTGRFARPRMRLDPDARPAVLARAGAAIASAGVTVLGTALADAAESKNNPCEAVLR